MTSYLGTLAGLPFAVAGGWLAMAESVVRELVALFGGFRRRARTPVIVAHGEAVTLAVRQYEGLPPARRAGPRAR